MKSPNSLVKVILLFVLAIYIISDHSTKLYGGSLALITDCYTSVVRDFTLNSISHDFIKGSTNCADTIDQLNKTGFFLGTLVETTQCPGSNYFCCAKKNAANQLITVFCQNIPGN